MSVKLHKDPERILSQIEAAVFHRGNLTDLVLDLRAALESERKERRLLDEEDVEAIYHRVLSMLTSGTFIFC